MVITVVAAAIGKVLVLGGLGTAVVWDLVKRIIPDTLVLTVGGGGLLLRLVSAERYAVWTSVAAAGTVFLALLPLAKWGTLGGGDAKLMATVAVGQPAAAMCSILLSIAVAGGVLSAFCLVNNWARNLGDRRIAAVAGWHAEMPYAPAILAGVVWHELWDLIT
jgi:Flp pilus assembly protein protease CpaA